MQMTQGPGAALWCRSRVPIFLLTLNILQAEALVLRSLRHSSRSHRYHLRSYELCSQASNIRVRRPTVLASISVTYPATPALHDLGYLTGKVTTFG